jgi:hypothetical protein
MARMTGPKVAEPAEDESLQEFCAPCERLYRETLEARPGLEP